MVTSLNALIFEIYEDLKITSDDTWVDRRLVERKIVSQRATWIRKQNTKENYIDSTYLQTICVPMELVDAYSCGCEELGTECTILRSTTPIPNAIELKAQKGILKVSGADILSPPMDFIDYERAYSWGNGRFNTKRVAFFIKEDNYLYGIHKNNIDNKLIEKVKFTFLPEDPREAEKFESCEGGPCWTADSPYPINLNLWVDFVKPNVIRELYLIKQSGKDNVNNAKDDLQPTYIPKNDTKNQGEE
jgi:hypothetical protein